MDEALEELRATLDRADGVVSREPWYRSAVSHAIPPERLACSYYFAWLSRSCLGIACDFGEGERGDGWWGCGVEHAAVERSLRLCR